MKKLFLLIPVLLLAGCSGVKEVGQVGNVTFYRVNVRGFSGPNITTLVSEKEGVVRIETAAAGGGIGHTIVSSAGHVGAAAAFGLSLRPDDTQTQVSNDSGSYSASRSGASSSASGSGSSGFVPPGHVDNPGQGNTHGNGHNTAP